MAKISKSTHREINHSKGTFADDTIYLVLQLVKGPCLRYTTSFIHPMKRLVISLRTSTAKGTNQSRSEERENNRAYKRISNL